MSGSPPAASVPSPSYHSSDPNKFYTSGLSKSPRRNRSPPRARASSPEDTDTYLPPYVEEPKISIESPGQGPSVSFLTDNPRNFYSTVCEEGEKEAYTQAMEDNDQLAEQGQREIEEVGDMLAVTTIFAEEMKFIVEAARGVVDNDGLQLLQIIEGITARALVGLNDTPQINLPPSPQGPKQDRDLARLHCG